MSACMSNMTIPIFCCSCVFKYFNIYCTKILPLWLMKTAVAITVYTIRWSKVLIFKLLSNPAFPLHKNPAKKKKSITMRKCPYPARAHPKPQNPGTHQDEEWYFGKEKSFHVPSHHSSRCRVFCLLKTCLPHGPAGNEKTCFPPSVFPCPLSRSGQRLLFPPEHRTQLDGALGPVHSPRSRDTKCQSEMKWAFWVVEPQSKYLLMTLVPGWTCEEAFGAGLLQSCRRAPFPGLHQVPPGEESTSQTENK